MTRPSFCSSIILKVPSVLSLLFDPPCPILPSCYLPSSIPSLSSFMCSSIAHHVPSLFILLFHHPPNSSQPSFLYSSITHPSHSSFTCSITHHILFLFPVHLHLSCPTPSAAPPLSSHPVPPSSAPVTHCVPSTPAILLRHPPHPIFPFCASPLVTMSCPSFLCSCIFHHVL